MCIRDSSLLEWDTAFCLETMTDAILREEVDILVLQEVNQGIETVVAEDVYKRQT